ncbi:hypothetical protein SPRG_07784 [Saprolegnia parasitica CBS 223.65]|uniref:C2H2-type domain-containing protein n=1 Tax=Saprolegnia parasitica (strain CBS 223.65) TaxID=695850 RepID=A0A067C8H8_SAPPC|nr:hypothetical protein SPRG_07784 [Saprolegnia parasitica CBS 223.65]KDO27074.1 hypothetical protein SPRG_07784 [Saprolegnia parasitica CBS 223.65]|eukprot:XP_012202168.1 hypothetical protein SPRG_07784 [Saprolegnia parasitica CBS 223.65]
MLVTLLLNETTPPTPLFRSIPISFLLCAEDTIDDVKPPKKNVPKYCCNMDGCDRVSQRFGLCHRHGGKRACKAPNCESKDRGSGFCIKHGGGRPCEIATCTKKVRRKGVCAQHFRQLYHASP